MFFAIVHNTPTWVFGLFFVLVLLGARQSMPHRITLRRSMIVPSLLVAVSLAGVVSVFGANPLALLAWGAGLAAALVSFNGRVSTTGVSYDAAGRQFAMPGSWVPLALLMSLFAIKYCAGFIVSNQPAIAGDSLFATATSAAYGVFSGLFLVRAAALWALARHSLANGPAAIGEQRYA